MSYSDFIRLDRRECRGYNYEPHPSIFDSHDIGTLKGYFSNYERYNDSNVSISMRSTNSTLDITINSDLDKNDAWVRWKFQEAFEFVRRKIIDKCNNNGLPLEITINLNTY